MSYGKRGRVAYVTLDRPAVLNAMSLRLFSVGQDPRQRLRVGAGL
ncbi:hypothetical protein [Streptomyces murinus]|nr:hypothetical protein [Streptomyces murinus]